MQRIGTPCTLPVQTLLIPTQEQETFLRSIPFILETTQRACLTRKIRIDFHRHRVRYGRFVGNDFLQLGKGPFRSTAIGTPRFRRYRYYLFTPVHMPASTRTFSNACEVLKADEHMRMPFR